MTNYSVIDKAAREIVKYQDTNYATSMSWDDALELAADWYNHTDLTSPYMISACALKYGRYKPVTTKEIVEACKEYEK